MTTIKEKLSRGINPPNMLQSMASGYRREALAEIERLEKVIDELRAENKRLALIVSGYEMSYCGADTSKLRAELALEKADYAIYRDDARIQREKLRDQIKELESKLSASQSQ